MSSPKFLLESRKLLESKTFLLLFASLLAVALSISHVASEPRPQEKFLSISTWGSDMTTGSYYPRGTSIISVGDTIDWYLNIYNRMGSSEYLSVKIKLVSNSTGNIPDNLSHAASTENSIFEINELLRNNSTLVTPLTWTITKIEKVGNEVVIKGIQINGERIDELNVRSLDGSFRMIVELWKYNTESRDFDFSWSSGQDKRSAWNQIWFSIR